MSIELIYPGQDTVEAVKSLDNDWLISGPIRACIFLSNAWHRLEPSAMKKSTYPEGKGGLHYSLNGVNVFGPNELDHLWSQWVVLSDKNYAWLYFYALDMCEEYVRRFPHLTRHGVSRMLAALENMPESIPEGVFYPAQFAVDVEYKP